MTVVVAELLLSPSASWHQVLNTGQLTQCMACHTRSCLPRISARVCSVMKRGANKRSVSARADSGTAQTSAEPARRRRTKQPKVEERAQTASVTYEDGLVRCAWAGMYKGASSADYIKYHDEEWGRPVHDEKQLFELLILEGAQAGLSWSTILAKRDAYRSAFKGFDPVKVAALTDDEVNELLQNAGIVRNKAKILSTVRNAKVFLQLQKEHGSFDHFVWGFVPDRRPIINKWTNMTQVPAKTPEAEALSAALKSAGMKFVGPTIMYAFMQAAGLVNDHTTGCHCYNEIVNSYDE